MCVCGEASTYSIRVEVCVCVCVLHLLLCVSAASFIPPDILASFLWAQEQLATPVGHSHNEKITIYEPGATHLLICTHTHAQAQRSTYSRQRHTLSWLICFLLCCFVTAPSGSNSQRGLPEQKRYSHRACLFYFFQDIRRLLIVGQKPS